MNIKSFKYRADIIKNLKKFNLSFGLQLEQKISIADIDSIFTHIKSNEKKSKNLIEKHLNDEFSLSSIYLTCLSSIAVMLTEEKGGKHSLFPSNWFDKKIIANPNFVFGNLVIQIANYSLSIINLLNSGLSTPAKSLIRIHNDLIWQSLILLYDKKMFAEFCSSENLEDPSTTWYKLFARGKLNKKINAIEASLGLDQKTINSFMKWRQDKQNFYSGFVHHSFMSVNFGAMAFDFESDNLQPSLLGYACSTSKQTIDILNFQVFYFLELFMQITSKVHKIRLDTKNYFGYIGVISNLVYKDMFLKYYANT